MTFAVVLTVAVSLTLFGTGLMVRGQVDAMKDYWYDRVEVSVFLCGKASDPQVCPDGAITDEQRETVLATLESLRPEVQEVYYESQEEAYERFQEQFADSPILENVTPEAMPESFRVKLANPENFAVVASAVGTMPGVEQVQDQKQLLERFFNLLNWLRNLALGVAAAMLIVTVLLVVNTMRTAAYARRKETGIMKLVGASNIYIMTPFVLEAVIAASIGGLLAVGAVGAEKYFLIDQTLAPSFRFTSFVGWDTTIMVMVTIFLTGVVLAGASALWAIRRYLKV